MALLRAGILTDCHIPWEHKRRYGAMLNVFADARLDALYIIGDYADAYNVQMHGPRDPRIGQTFTDEVAAVNSRLDEIDKTWPSIKKGYVEGNHETRFERYIIANASAVFGVTELKFLLGMNTRPGWTWLPYGPRQLGKVLDSKLYIRHEPCTVSITALAKEHGCSVTFGHIHRIVEIHHNNLIGEQWPNFCSGWMGDERYPVFNYVKGAFKWQNGFCIVHVDSDTGLFYHNTIGFQSNDTCVYGGKLYRP